MNDRCMQCMDPFCSSKRPFQTGPSVSGLCKRSDGTLQNWLQTTPTDWGGQGSLGLVLQWKKFNHKVQSWFWYIFQDSSYGLCRSVKHHQTTWWMGTDDELNHRCQVLFEVELETVNFVKWKKRESFVRHPDWTPQVASWSTQPDVPPHKRRSHKNEAFALAVLRYPKPQYIHLIYLHFSIFLFFLTIRFQFASKLPMLFDSGHLLLFFLETSLGSDLWDFRCRQSHPVAASIIGGCWMQRTTWHTFIYTIYPSSIWDVKFLRNKHWNTLGPFVSKQSF